MIISDKDKDITCKITVFNKKNIEFKISKIVEKLDNGNYLLGVYIADVSNYVKEGTFLDADAFERGTSCYLPDRVIPMLPKKLSNGICSLNENVDRLVMACEMEINNLGEIVSSELFEGIIKTRHRMTYDSVNLIINGDESEIKNYQDTASMINLANELAKILNEKRVRRGAFMFEAPEAKLILNNNGVVKDIVLRERKDAECLIEEFMLAANECVAETMTWLDVPFIYRVHEEPKDEKINKLLMLVNNFGYEYKINNQKNVL